MEKANVKRILTELKRVTATASNEEEFKIIVESVLYDEVIEALLKYFMERSGDKRELWRAHSGW